MDDLTMLSEFRVEVPEPDAARLASTRARLVAGTGHAGHAGRTVGAGGRRKPFWNRPVLLAGAFGVVAALVLAFVRFGPTGDATRPPVAERYASTAVVLEQAALVAETRSTGSAPRPNQWQYSKVLDRQPNGDPGDRDHRESWIRYDGKQTAGYDEAGQVTVSDHPPDPGDDDLSPMRYAEKLRKLPTDPAKLLAHVRGDRHWVDYPVEEKSPKGEQVARAETPDERAFRVLSLYLQQQAVMPPKLEAAMYRALAQIPGVRVQLDVEDGAGRRGMGLFREYSDAMRTYFILDEKTYRYLGMRMVWFRDQYMGSELVTRAGSVWTVTQLASAIVDKPGQRP
ncbi:hypothetical protein GCM10022226_27130 [Sphaerisporangium flaviroseum]|uniref:CU044_5270 family protein n=1 Tax=Sphaerisporangium flaviroseum TaxID=509199 RepID=A0ABP7HY91_9ACTN